MGKESAMQETQVRSLGQEDLLQKGMATTPVFLPGESHGQRSLEGYSSCGAKELDTTEQLTLSLPIHYAQLKLESDVRCIVCNGNA